MVLCNNYKISRDLRLSFLDDGGQIHHHLKKMMQVSEGQR